MEHFYRRFKKLFGFPKTDKSILKIIEKTI